MTAIVLLGNWLFDSECHLIMFAHNTVKIVDYQHLKFCKVSAGNTDVFLDGTRRGSGGD